MKNECLLTVTNELDAAGVPYRVEQGGKHLRVRFGPNHEHLQVLPTSSGDRRAHLNARADVRRALRRHAAQEAVS